MKYELLDQENLMHLIRYAGGLKPGALKRNVKIKRFENDLELILNADLNELEAGKKRLYLKKWEMRWSLVRSEDGIENKVAIFGAVRDTGEYAFVEGMRFSDLINRAVLKENAVLKRHTCRRYNVDMKTVRYEIVNVKSALVAGTGSGNPELKKRRCNYRAGSFGFWRINKVVVAGAVKESLKFELGRDGNMKVSDALFLAGRIKEDAADFAYLFQKKGMSWPRNITSLM